MLTSDRVRAGPLCVVWKTNFPTWMSMAFSFPSHSNFRSSCAFAHKSVVPPVVFAEATILALFPHIIWKRLLLSSYVDRLFSTRAISQSYGYTRLSLALTI